MQSLARRDKPWSLIAFGSTISLSSQLCGHSFLESDRSQQGNKKWYALSSMWKMCRRRCVIPYWWQLNLKFHLALKKNLLFKGLLPCKRLEKILGVLRASFDACWVTSIRASKLIIIAILASKMQQCVYQKDISKRYEENMINSWPEDACYSATWWSEAVSTAWSRRYRF